MDKISDYIDGCFTKDGDSLLFKREGQDVFSCTIVIDGEYIEQKFNGERLMRLSRGDTMQVDLFDTEITN